MTVSNSVAIKEVPSLLQVTAAVTAAKGWTFLPSTLEPKATSVHFYHVK